MRARPRTEVLVRTTSGWECASADRQRSVMKGPDETTRQEPRFGLPAAPTSYGGRSAEGSHKKPSVTGPDENPGTTRMVSGGIGRGNGHAKRPMRTHISPFALGRDRYKAQPKCRPDEMARTGPAPVLALRGLQQIRRRSGSSGSKGCTFEKELDPPATWGQASPREEWATYGLPLSSGIFPRR